MSEKIVVSDNDITKFLKYLVEITPTLEVDPDGYVLIKETEEKVKLGVSGEVKDTEVMKPLIVYQSVIKDPDVIVLNPFIEGIAKNISSDWFADIIVTNASNMLRMIQKALIIHTLESKRVEKVTPVIPKKKGKSKDAEVVSEEETKPMVAPIDLKLAGIVSKWVDKVDDLTISELDQITKKLSNYFTITYFRKSHEARVTCGVWTDDFRTAHKKVRFKTWELVSDMLKYIFNTEDFEEYSSKSNSTACPKVDALLKTLLKVYTALNPYMKYLPKEAKENMIHTEIDLNYLSANIDLLEVFKSKTAHITTTAPASPNAVKVNPLEQALSRNSLFRPKIGSIGFGQSTNNIITNNGSSFGQVRPLGSTINTIPRPNITGNNSSSFNNNGGIFTNGW